MLKVLACIEDRDFRSNRELDRGVILRLAETEGNITEGAPPPDKVSETALCTYCAPETKIPAQNPNLNGNFA